MQGPGVKGMSLQPAWLCGTEEGDAQSSSAKGHPQPIGACGGAGTRGEASFPLGCRGALLAILQAPLPSPSHKDWVTAEASVWVDDGLFCKQSCPGANNTAEQIDGRHCLLWEEENDFS